MAKMQFVGDNVRYGVAKDTVFDGDFRCEGNTVFVESETFTNVHSSVSDFLDSYKFLDYDNPIKRVRKHTDLEHTRYFTTGEAAEFLGVSDQTVRNWVEKGNLREVFRVGGRRRVLREDCVELLASLKEGGL